VSESENIVSMIEALRQKPGSIEFYSPGPDGRFTLVIRPRHSAPDAFTGKTLLDALGKATRADANRLSHPTPGAGITEGREELIAAAPDLLAACKEALIIVDEAYDATGFIKVCKTSTQRMRLEAAIAKAESPAPDAADGKEK